MAPPVIVIVPAACQPPSLYTPFAKALEASSISWIVVSTPSVGASPGLPDFLPDVAIVRDTVISILDEGRDVVVLMHSYGGIPGSAALRGLGTSERAKMGKNTGVIRLVYVSCIILRDGEKMQGAGDIENLRKYASKGLDEKAGTLLISPQAAAFMFFHDLPEAESQHWASILKPHSLGAMWSSQTYTAWQDIPSTYVVCNLDRVMPVEKQEAMIRHAREVQPKAFDVVERVDSGHEPILSKIDDLVGVVERAIKGAGTW
ncbi:hypothetical protein ACLMJK_001951 [Lecanora helva]